MRLNVARYLVLLIALVVPLQGMAAVMAGQCMAFGHHDAGATPSDHGHDHAAHADHDHGGGSTDQSSDDGKGSHCGPCTACCASASIAAHAGFAAMAERFTAPYVFAQLPPPSIELDGLDRPPLAL